MSYPVQHIHLKCLKLTLREKLTTELWLNPALIDTESKYKLKEKIFPPACK